MEKSSMMSLMNGVTDPSGTHWNVTAPGAYFGHMEYCQSVSYTSGTVLSTQMQEQENEVP